ncbi:unnamed protein product [Rotaria sp. Silwood1]|nr:unnamed protein product [Rotaria sp. Silwood1]CAF1603132.1 unnamed protein product [Rotaria sp. Silwood1]CAF1604774.1 unnamed protein product [Rotaria sp. Silwood1]CAF4725926.1 unnamed protein product [Rotaria sp. Silwood1]
MNKSIQQQTTNPGKEVEPSTNSFVDQDFDSNMHINENLLLEAQIESSHATSKSSQSDSSSPKTPKSPIQTTTLISSWEWRFLHPINQNLYDEDEEKKLIEKKHMRYLILSNCASFILGMGIMYLCVRRYLRMKTPYFYSLD